MGNFGTPSSFALVAANTSVEVIEAADPVTMKTRLQARLDEIAAGGTQVVTDFSLAGAGDGHPFVVQLTILTTGAPAPEPTCYVYEAASSDELAHAAFLAYAAVTADGNLVESTALAGGGKGHRWMGILLASAAA